MSNNMTHEEVISHSTEIFNEIKNILSEMKDGDCVKTQEFIGKLEDRIDIDEKFALSFTLFYSKMNDDVYISPGRTGGIYKGKKGKKNKSAKTLPKLEAEIEQSIAAE